MSYDIEANLVCWSCKNASIQKGREFYGIKDFTLPKRPACQLSAKSWYIDDWDVPEPCEAINENGCSYAPIGYDLRLIELYSYCKHDIIKQGYQKDIDNYKQIPSLDEMDKWYFFQEYVWVVLNTGMKNQVAEKIFRLFWNNGDFKFDEINHKYKKRDIEKVYSNLDNFFKNLQESDNKLQFLESIPFIGKKTKFHLAKNLGLDYAKPDRHLERIAAFFHYDSVQDFCEVIAKASHDDIKVVDVVFWRYANLFKNYLENFTRFLQKIK